MFGEIFHDFIEGPWEQARGFVRLELESLRGALNAHWSGVFNDDDTLSADAIAGDPTAGLRYVANTGENFSPKWEKAVHLITTDDEYIQGGPITETGEIGATDKTKAILEVAQHSLLGGL